MILQVSIDTEVDEDSVEIKADLSLLNDVSIFTYMLN
jgi:hypothetical protein